MSETQADPSNLPPSSQPESGVPKPLTPPNQPGGGTSHLDQPVDDNVHELSPEYLAEVFRRVGIPDQSGGRFSHLDQPVDDNAHRLSPEDHAEILRRNGEYDEAKRVLEQAQIIPQAEPGTSSVFAARDQALRDAANARPPEISPPEDQAQRVSESDIALMNQAMELAKHEKLASGQSRNQKYSEIYERLKQRQQDNPT